MDPVHRPRPGSGGGDARSALHGGEAAMTGPVFLYDGDFAFCSLCAEFLGRRVRTAAEVEPWQWADLEALGVDRQAAEDAVQGIEPGLVKAGPDAIAVL